MPIVEINLEAAKKISKRAKIGDVVGVPVETKKFGRIAAQAAKQVIIQGIREAERGLVFEEFTSKEHEILTGVVSHIEPRNGSVSITHQPPTANLRKPCLPRMSASRPKSSKRVTASRSTSLR